MNQEIKMGTMQTKSGNYFRAAKILSLKNKIIIIKIILILGLCILIFYRQKLQAENIAKDNSINNFSDSVYTNINLKLKMISVLDINFRSHKIYKDYMQSDLSQILYKLKSAHGFEGVAFFIAPKLLYNNTNWFSVDSTFYKGLILKKFNSIIESNDTSRCFIFAFDNLSGKLYKLQGFNDDDFVNFFLDLQMNIKFALKNMNKKQYLYWFEEYYELEGFSFKKLLIRYNKKLKLF